MELIFVVITLDIIALVIAYSFVISLKFYNIIYHALYFKKSHRSYAPTISIFIPCKGRDDHLEDHVNAFLCLRSDRTKLFFIVESKDDPTYPIIKQYISNTRHAYLIVAGLAKTCGQKNHNLLQGIKASEERDDVYVFLDAYTTITEQQLRDLVLPLSNPKIPVAVGFRWNLLNKKTLGERLHAFMIALQWSIMNCFCVQSVWGGATAIKRADFEKLGVREYWAQTVVDDMTLQKIIQKARKKAVFVPTCVKETDNTLGSLREALLWFKRQSLYVKFYLRPYWIATIGILLYPSLNILGFPFLLGYAVTYHTKKSILLTLSTGTFIVLTMFYCLFLKRAADDHHSRLSWFLLSPLYLVLTCFACLLGAFTNVLHWRGISYQLDYNGHVKKIVRK